MSTTPNMPGLTGLRGVAVVAVVAYHLGLLRGGFLGVDVFFVLSGFLITTLLLHTEPSVPRGLIQWWMKRFRRLTPAVALVVMAVLIAFATRSGVVMNSIATLTWWQNWHLIIEGRPYWAPGPSALRHAWSLSIEEQFYALWPITLLTTLAIARRLGARRPRLVVAGVALAIAVASFTWAGFLAADGNTPMSRIYYGTDTRIGGLLVGCAAAALTNPTAIDRLRRATSIAAMPAALVLAVLAVTISPESRFTYGGGLVLASTASIVLVLASAGTGPLTVPLRWAPLQWLGVHSYALYLWSWPVQVVAEEHLPRAPKLLIVVITIASSVLLSALSLRLVEDPLRRRSSWATRAIPRRSAWMAGYGLIAILLLVAANSTRATAIEKVAQEFEQLPDPTTTSTTSTICVPPSTSSTTTPEFTGGTDDFDRSTVSEGTDPSRDPCAPSSLTVLMVGDSTGRGAANGLRRLDDPGLTIWDRTVIGCGLVAPSDRCPDWESSWAEAVDQIDPDVVVVYLGVSGDLIPGAEPEFMSPEGDQLRRSTIARAVDLLSAKGAKVLWTLPARVDDRAAYYCDNKMESSPCDPAWIERWRADVSAVAAEKGFRTVDLQSWVDGRPSGSDETDRPDGLHFSGPALDAHAAWLASQIELTVLGY